MARDGFITHGVAAPARTLGRIVAGRGKVRRSANNTVIIQNSHKLVLGWQSFDIAAGETVVIRQPDVTAQLVIRVADANGSAILGHLRANGRVQIVNAEGLVVGPRGRVEAAALALTGQTNRHSASASADSGGAEIINRGKLDIRPGGTVLLRGMRVVNHGDIRAPAGKVRLIGRRGDTINSGMIDVTGERGGRIELLSDRDVLVQAGSRIDASGRLAGGQVRIGGGYMGGEGLLQARRAYVDAAAIVRADATVRGTAGSVVVFSDRHTVSAGLLAARGDIGGLVETSSHGGLSVIRAADVSAARGGEAGTWLLDPNNIEIVAAGSDANITASTPFRSTDDSSTLTVGTLKTALIGGTNVTVQTMSAGANTEDGDITFTANLDYDGIGSGGTLTLDADRHIVINGSITDSDSSGDTLALTLTAGAAVTFNNTVHVASLDVTSAGDITQTVAGVLTVAGVSSFAAGAHAIVLDNTGNHVTGAVTLTNSGANAVVLDNGNNALKLGTVDVGSSVLTIQNYAGPLTLTGDVTTEGGPVNFTTAVRVAAASVSIDTTGNGSSTAGANIVFGNTLDAATAGTNSLTLQAGTAGNISLGGMVGNGKALQSLHATGDSIVFSGGAITTTSTQVYDAAVVVNNAATLTGVGITFNKAVDSSGGTPINLTIHGGTGAVDFNDIVGGGFTLGALAIDGSGSLGFTGTVAAASLSTGTGTVTLGGNVTTIGAQMYNGAVLLGTGITLATTNSSVHFKGAVDNAVNGIPETLTVNAGAGAVDFDAALGGSNGALGALALSGSGATSLAAVTAASLDTGTGNITLHGDVSTSGSQAYDGALLLDGSGNSVALIATNITFDGTVDNVTSGAPQALTLNLTGPVASVFNMAVGSGNGALGALTVVNLSNQIQFKQAVHAASLDVGGAAVTFANISTTGAQTWGGDLQLINALTLQSGSGGITFDGTVLTPMPGTALTVDAGSGAVTFNADVNVSALTATAADGITQGSGSTLNIAGSTTLDAGNSAITLANSGNNFHGGVTASGGGVSLTDVDDLTITSLTDSNNGDVSLIAGGLLGLTQAINAGSGNITLAANGGSLSTLALTGTDINLTGRDGITLGGNVTAVGALALTSTNATITQLGGMFMAIGVTTVNAGSGTITLANVGNDFQNTVDLTGGTTQLVDSNALTLGTLNTGALTVTSGAALNLGSGNVTGNLSATSSAGGISQTGALTIIGTATLAATGAAVTLTNTGNDFQSGVSASGAGVSLTDTNGLSITSLTDSNNGNVDLNAGGPLLLGADVLAGTGAITLQAGSAMTLDHALDAASIDLTAGGLIAATGSIQGNTTVHAGTFEPGSGGIGGTITGDYVQLSAAGLHIEVGLIGSHQLAVSGSASLAGTLAVDFSNNPAAGDDFTVLSAASRTGTFGVVAATGLAVGLEASANYDATRVQMNVNNAVPDLAISITDNREYVHYGQSLNYLVTLENKSSFDAVGATLANALPPNQLDAGFTTWLCLPGSAMAICTTSGSGPLQDSNITIPADSTMYWLVSTLVRGDAPGATLDNAVTVTAVDPHSATDSDVLVLFHDGFDGPVPLSMSLRGVQSSAALVSRCTHKPADDQALLLSMPRGEASSTVQTILNAATDDGTGFRVERTTLGTSAHVRLVAVDGSGHEWPGAWALATPGAPLALAITRTDRGATVRLDGASKPLSLPLAHPGLCLSTLNHAVKESHSLVRPHSATTEPD